MKRALFVLLLFAPSLHADEDTITLPRAQLEVLTAKYQQALAERQEALDRLDNMASAALICLANFSGTK